MRQKPKKRDVLVRNRVREVHWGFVFSEEAQPRSMKEFCTCVTVQSEVTHSADMSPSERISSCARTSVTHVRIQDPGCKHGAAALQMWQGTAQLCPERSSLEGDAIKVLPLNPLAVLAQRSEQVHTWGNEDVRQQHGGSKDDSRTQASKSSSSRSRSVI